MSSAIIRNGHWRRRDPLKGLNDAMLAALRLADVTPLSLLRGAYGIGDREAYAPATVQALAVRGLLRLSAGRDGRRRDYVLTPAGREIVVELRRREAARAALIAERPARAVSC